MTDLISRQAAINALENTECELLPEEWDELTDAIKNLPSAQPEIIRCKDCKWYECSIMATNFGVCCHPEWVVDNCGFAVYENGWCYRAERRTDE